MSRSVVLFDVMDTLVRDPFRDVMPAFFGLSLEALIAEKHPTAFLEFEVGARDEQSFLDDFFVDRRPFDHEAFKRTVFSAYAWLPGIEALLRELAAAGVPMHTASNYPSWYRAVEAATTLSRYVAWTGVSTHLGVRKPDPTFFERLLERIGEPASACVFVDDQPRNCDAAAALGIHAVRFRSAESLRLELRAVGLPV